MSELASFCRLSWTRLAPGPKLAFVAVALALVSLRSLELEGQHENDVAAFVRAGWTRAAVWAAFALCTGLLLVWRSAHVHATWRDRDRFFLSPRGASAVRLALSELVVQVAWVSLAAGLVLIGLEPGRSTGDSAPTTWSRVRALETLPVLLAHDGQTVRLPLDLESPKSPGPDEAAQRGAGRALGFAPVLVSGSGPSAELEVRILAADGALVETRLLRVSGTGPRVLELPNQLAPAELELCLRGHALIAVPGDALTLLHASSGPAAASFRLAWRILVALAAASALALGLGAWMRPALAFLATVALGILLVSRGPAVVLLRRLPGADAVLAWRDVGNGLVPPPADPVALALALASVLAALLAFGGATRARRELG